MRRFVSEKTILLIEGYASKGESDVDISKKLGLSYSAVSKYTTRYWNRKMKEKNQTDNEQK